ncbi:PREDICTED: uncharacterized protein LOC109463988 [Branchiostoma belcheri]|uniref:Uncharacterized protein LOC109463988 n=1 Tax=Branchiostoma belcheri TaxID=7741 RepID=A0A6P4YHI6_BRABE|nr:PREDICTED: uncharacterized protein LOC109463988 [Branchiostoma belcheri]
MHDLLKIFAGVTLLFASCYAGGKRFHIAVSESADPGHVIMCLGGLTGKTTYRITDGNKDDRFAIDRDSGNVYVKRYLNFDIDSHYDVTVTDDDDGLFPFMVQVSSSSMLGYRLLYSDGHKQGKRSTLSLNDQCGAKAYVVMRDEYLTTQIPPGTTPHFLASCTNTRDPTRGTLSATPYWNATYERPPDVAIDPQWFANKTSSRYAARRHVLLIVDMADIVTDNLPVSDCRLEFETATGFSFKFQAMLALDAIGCPDGYYGGTCRNVCVCQNGGRCHPFNGACKCPDGWTGRACDIVDPKIVISAERSDVMSGQTVQISCAVFNVDPSSTFAWALNGRQLSPSDGVTEILTSRGFDGMNRTFVNTTIIANISSLADSGEYACAYVTSSGKLYRESTQISLEGESIALYFMSALALGLIVAMATQCEINRRKRKAAPTAGPPSVPDVKARNVQLQTLIARGAVENEYEHVV